VSAIKVDIWSDIACPWCYIGKRKFEAGVAAYGGEVEIEYHSFELSPDTPVDFEGSAVDFLAGHKGLPRPQVEQMIDRVVAIARDVDLEYDYAALKQTNTVRAHELLHFAKANGRQLEMKERLLKAYFIEGRHVGRVEDLADLAAEVGLDRAETVAALTSGRFLADVRDDQRTATELGITGVPFFVFEGRFGVSGAQEAATFANVLEQVAAELDEGAVAPAGV
jgi:predicted DsbA family dithiol-disulfide isomerase